MLCLNLLCESSAFSHDGAAETASTCVLDAPKMLEEIRETVVSKALSSSQWGTVS